MAAEDQLIDWLRSELARRGLQDLLGDDVARLTLSGDWAVSADQQVERIHFPSGLAANRIGRRLVCVNLSDLAAAGAEPRYAMVTLGAPAGFGYRNFFMAVLDACQDYGLELVGGDLSGSPHVHASMTIFGRRRARGHLLHRNRARASDLLWLGGPVGDSALGRELLARGASTTAKTVRLPGDLELGALGSLSRAARRSIARHLDPRPQLELGAWLAARRRAAAIDVSDGVLLDLERLARESKVRCELDATALPESPGFAELARRLGQDPSTVALTGGEDYVLLFALPEGTRPPASYQATVVGRVTRDVERRRESAVVLLGAEPPPGPTGWDHLST